MSNQNDARPAQPAQGEPVKDLTETTGGTPANQQDAPQYLAEDEQELDPIDAASADSFPSSDPPSTSNPSAV